MLAGRVVGAPLQTRLVVRLVVLVLLFVHLGLLIATALPLEPSEAAGAILVVSALSLGAIWVRAFLRRHLGYAEVIGTMATVAAMAVFDAGRGETDTIVTLVALMFASHASSYRQLALTTGLLVLADVVSETLWDPTPGPTLMAYLLGLPLLALTVIMVHFLDRGMALGDETLRLQTVLARAGTEMVAADGLGQVAGAATVALGQILSNGRPAVARVSDGQVAFEIGGGSLPRARREALATLSTQVSLATERIASSDRLTSLVRHSADIIAVVDASGRIGYVSPAVEQVLGHLVEDVVGQPMESLLEAAEVERVRRMIATRDGGTVRLQHQMRHRDGTMLNIETAIHDLLDNPSVGGLVLNSRDITATKALEEQLRERALHDPLTGLPNRILFHDRVAHALTQRGQENRPAVMFIDVDDFKNVNDSLGHATGDRLLCEIGDRIRTVLRSGDTAARLSGDEFATLLESCSGPREAEAVAARLIEVLRQPVAVDGREILVTVSVGVALGRRLMSAERLLQDADLAMYQAKSTGKNRHQVFDGSMHVSTVERFELESDLRHAVAREELVLEYQPVFAAGAEPVGAEALLRWEHPLRGRLLPGAFIEIAESTGEIVPITRWIMAEAARQATAWNALWPGFWVSVNVSGRHLLEGTLVADVKAALRDSGLPPHLLVLELTEGASMAGAEASAQLAALHAAGVRLAVDDFGTGYSSLSYLADLPVDIVKVDRSFVTTGAAHGYALMRGIIGLAGTLHKTVVVEGVETVEQLAAVHDAGARTLSQGYLLGRPAGPGALSARLAEGRLPATRLLATA
ncbi:MAG TPA: EAL domain-containing protein [Candidatus Dormibacteraeota bacterium]|nr:EAL domain-containing protein [Candidatus Dormibacteraeota bacterium]